MDNQVVGGLLENFYAFSYKLNVKRGFESTVTKQDYDLVLRHIVNSGGYIRFVYYELDSQNEWHIHGAAHFELEPRYTKLTVKGYGSRWYKIYDYAGWEDYAKKDVGEDQEPNSVDDLKVMPTHSLFK